MTSLETLAAILLWLAALLAVARAGGRLAEVARQPAVLGELLAGIAAGALPTVDKRTGMAARRPAGGGAPTLAAAGPGADSTPRAATAARRSAAAGRVARGGVLSSRRPQPLCGSALASGRLRRRRLARRRNRPLVARH